MTFSHLKPLAALLLAATATAQAQTPDFTVQRLPLPKELAHPENQFSGLYPHQGQLFLLAESRLQDQHAGRLYAIGLADLDRKLTDTSYVLPYRQYPLRNLPELRRQVEAAGQRFEGLEAMVIDGKRVYLSLETETNSPLAYLLRGELTDSTVVLDPAFLLPVTKPRFASGAPVYNAAFEAMTLRKKSLYAFFEYNYFPGQNPVTEFRLRKLSSQSQPRTATFDRLPFRITDMTPTGKNHFTALNYFFSGGGADTVYRVPQQDAAADQRIRSGTEYRSYVRLIDVELKDGRFRWTPLWTFPAEYRAYNWEGIAAHGDGYFVLNDKYTPRRPYQSTLLYLRRK